MSDHGHHDPGGHELEGINTKLLFRLMISLSFVTLLASIAVVQWFYSQRHELETTYAAEGSFQLRNYKTKMDADLQGIDGVVQSVAGNPALLQAPVAPSGWTHPDDLVGGTAIAEPDHAEHAAEPANKGDTGLDSEPAPAEAAEPTAPTAEAEPVEPTEPVEVKAEKPADKSAEKPADKPAPKQKPAPADAPADNG